MKGRAYPLPRFHTNPFVKYFAFVLWLIWIETTTYEALIRDNGSRNKFFESICFVLLHQFKHARE
jgi:hypothetical protein